MQIISCPRFLATLMAASLFIGAGVESLHAKPPKSDGKAFLGVMIEDLDDDDREELKFKGKHGVLVEAVVDDGPAAKANLKSDDVIVRIGKKDVKSEKGLRDVLTGLSPGDQVSVVFYRDGKKRSADVVLATAPEHHHAMAMQREDADDDEDEDADDDDEDGSEMRRERRSFLGVETQTLEDQLAAYFQVESGALVEEVVEGSAAEKAGIKAGDVIVKVSDVDITSTASLGDAVRSHDPGATVKVAIVRNGQRMDVEATLDETSMPALFAIGGDPGKHVIIRKDKRVIDLDDLDDVIEEALEGLDIEEIERHIKTAIQSGQSQESYEQLRKEIEELRKQIEELKQNNR